MRADVARILVGMGYNSETDFEAHQLDDGSARLVWLAKTPQPDERAIDAAAATAFAALDAEAAKRVESDAARSEVKQAYSELQPLLEHKDPAIALLAAIVQKHLLATLGR